MIDFVHWLAAMEKVDGAPPGAYQESYSHALRQAQLDSLLDNSLAAAVIDLMGDMDEWSGTPAELLNKLNWVATQGSQRTRQWPQNAIALSKRLQPLQVGLRSQGIEVEFDRGKYRKITITKVEGSDHE